MASATNNDEKTMAEEELANGEEEPDRGKQPATAQSATDRGFFTIYKKGQGYWTRIGTALGAALLVILTANFIYTRLPPQVDWLNDHPRWLLGIVGAFMAGSVLLFWRLMNVSQNVDFLIATDSEMKKVNWTSRRELIGSTKVVILFMFMIATLLFVLDLYFTRLFYLVGVLAADAPLWEIVGRAYGSAAKLALDLVMGVIVFGTAAWAIWAAASSR